MNFNPRNLKHLLSDDHEHADFYKAFVAEQFILRDYLAIDRTMLANESTFLAYVRTGLAMTAAGATLMHFATNTGSDIIGPLLIVGGMGIFIIGTVRYYKMRKIIQNIRAHHHEQDLSQLVDQKENI